MWSHWNRRALATAAVAACILATSSASAMCLEPLGDINGDDKAGVVDVQCWILSVLAISADESSLLPECVVGDATALDGNCDGSINVSDAQLSIAWTLGSVIDLSLDGDDINNCPAACDDLDNDGSPYGEDCDQLNPDAYPGAPEDCTAADLDCSTDPYDATCDDSDACTVDSCQPESGCVAEPIACDDGSVCTTDICDPLAGCGYVSMDCDDGVPCTVDACDPNLGCAHTPNDMACDDGDGCTADVCDPVAGCQSAALDCDDQNACTADSCGDLNPTCCNEGDSCDDSECRATVCDIFPPCCNDTWSSFCVFVAAEACALCQAEGCVNEPVSCADGVACTVDSCDPQSGCSNLVDDALCSDGSDCTVDACDPDVGCSNEVDDSLCDDSVACTVDACVAADEPCPVEAPWNGACYAAVAETRTWESARDACESLGGHLATIGSAEENADVLAVRSEACGAVSAWIGLHDQTVEGQFEWVTGEEVTVEYWNSGEPNDFGGEDVVQLLVNGMWNDLPESSDVDCFVCEIASKPRVCESMPDHASCEDGSDCTETVCDSTVGCLATPVGVCPPSVDLSEFGADSGLALTGSATFDSGALRLTSAESPGAGAAWLAEAIEMDGLFSLRLEYRFGPTVDPGAYSLAMVIQSDGIDDESGGAGIAPNSVSIGLGSDPELQPDGSLAVSIFQPATEPVSVELPGVWFDGATHVLQVGFEGGLMTVWLDDAAVLEDVFVDLDEAGALDANGEGWVGLVADTEVPGGNHEVVAFGVEGSCVPAACTDAAGCIESGSCALAQRSALSCGDLGWNGAAFGSTEVCSHSFCEGLVTQSEAEWLCEAAGARLCTVAELLADEARDSGCDYDLEPTWSGSTCREGGVWVAPGSSLAAASGASCERATIALGVPRCCADTDVEAAAAVCVSTGESDCRDSDGCTIESCGFGEGCGVTTAETCSAASTGDCCGSNASAGCDDQNCQTCVCDVMPQCCTGTWTSECAAVATDDGACWQSCLVCSACEGGYQDHDGDGICRHGCSNQLCPEAGGCDDSSGVVICGGCTPGYVGAECTECAAGHLYVSSLGECRAECTAGEMPTCPGTGVGVQQTCGVQVGVSYCSCALGYTGDCTVCANGYQDGDGDGTCLADCDTAASPCEVGQFVVSCSVVDGEALHICGECQTHAECPEGTFCGSDAFCQNTKMDGSACSTSEECTSDVCLSEICVACASSDDCEPDEYCAVVECAPKLESGESCSGGSVCASGICEGVVCIDCLTHEDCNSDEYCEDGVCESLIGFGNPCEQDYQCASGACTLLAGCVSCEDDLDCDEGEFCAADLTCDPKLANGEACGAPQECQSGICDGFGCTPCVIDLDCPDGRYCVVNPNFTNSCDLKLANGTLCTADTQCASGTCDIVCSECLSSGDCGDDEYCEFIAEFNECNAKKDIGSICLAPDHCISGVCDGACTECTSEGECQPGEYCEINPLSENHCKSKKSAGQGCFDPWECESGVCDAFECTACSDDAACADDQYCEVILFGDNSCKSKEGLGTSCGANNECLSGICDGVCADCVDDSTCETDEYCNIPVAGTNSCVAKNVNGTICAFDNECASGICDLTCTACLTNSDCGSSEYCEFVLGGENSCEAKKVDGQACGDNGQCVSGICDGLCTDCLDDSTCASDEYCEIPLFGTNACVSKNPNGTVCGFDNECQSGICDLSCTACVVDSDCPSGSYCEVEIAGTNSCEPLLSNGTACTADAQCDSGVCDLLCTVCTEDSHCPENSYCKVQFGAANSCAELLALGAVCSFDSQCDSGLCDFQCTTCKNESHCDAGEYCDLGGGNECKDLKENGQGCLSAVECISDFCDIDCVDCLVDSDCGAGEYCNLNFVGLNTCDTLLANGQGCTLDTQCESGVCDVQCTACTEDSHCEAGEYCDLVLLGQNDCQTLKVNGEECGLDKECASGICDGFCADCKDDSTCDADEYCKIPVFGTNECVSKNANGVVCGFDNECQSGICDVACSECTQDSDCPSSKYCKVVIGGANSCEVSKSNGEGCSTDQECVSGICDLTCTECTTNSHCGASEYCKVVVAGTNSCQPKLSNGAGCDADGDCASNVCDAECTACTSDSHCSTNQWCKVVIGGQNSCETKKPNGSGCTTSGECTSGVCDTQCTECTNNSHCDSDEYCNVVFLSQNNCLNKKSKGQGCSNNAQCLSNNCSCTGLFCGTVCQ